MVRGKTPDYGWLESLVIDKITFVVIVAFHSYSTTEARYRATWTFARYYVPSNSISYTPRYVYGYDDTVRLPRGGVSVV